LRSGPRWCWLFVSVLGVGKGGGGGIFGDRFRLSVAIPTFDLGSNSGDR